MRLEICFEKLAKFAANASELRPRAVLLLSTTSTGIWNGSTMRLSILAATLSANTGLLFSVIDDVVIIDDPSYVETEVSSKFPSIISRGTSV